MKTEKYILEERNDSKATSWDRVCTDVFLSELLMAGLLSFMHCFLSDFFLKTVLTIFGILLPMLLILTKQWKNRERTAARAVQLLAALSVAVNPLNTYRGFLGWLNQWITLWNNRFDEYVPLFQGGEVSFFTQLQLHMALLCLGCLAVKHMVVKKRTVEVSLVMGFLFAMKCIFGLTMPDVCICAVFLCWICIWNLELNGFAAIRKNALMLLAAVIVLGGLYGWTENYTGSAGIQQLKENMDKQWEELRYGSDTLPGGNMTEACKMVGSGTESTLQLTLDQPQELYLKGFVGSSFDGKSWSVLGKNAYYTEEAGMLDWLEAQGLQVPFQYSVYDACVGTEDTGEQTLSVRNEGADRRYVYLPYTVSALTEGSGSVSYDWQMESKGFFGSRRYSVTMLDEATPSELIEQKALQMDQDQSKRYSEAEKIYRYFVYKNYLELTEEEAQWFRDTFFDSFDLTNASLYEVTEQIRIVFQSQSTYSDHPSVYTGQTDFPKWFLEEEKTGNAAYYATVATLAYRAAGIPARYVEGYYLSSAKAAGLAAKSITDVTLSQADAHAWTEVYMDGIGWMPIETIPGFYLAEYTTQQVLGAPKSSVNIQNQTADAQLEGTTTDTVKTLTDTSKEEKVQEVVKNTIQIAGILLLTGIVLWLFRLLLLLQYRIRRWHRGKRMSDMERGSGCRIYYSYVFQIFALAELPLSPDHPYDRREVLTERYPEILQEEYTHFLQVIQKNVFGEYVPEPAEYLLVQKFCEKASRIVYGKLDWRRKAKMKYIKALI